jgi:hypothetical protein
MTILGNFNMPLFLADDGQSARGIARLANARKHTPESILGLTKSMPGDRGWPQALAEA